MPLVRSGRFSCDVGLLEAAAALMQSIAPHQALVDGNQLLTRAAANVAFGINGWRFTLTNDEAYDLVIAVATGELSEVSEIAARQERSVEPF